MSDDRVKELTRQVIRYGLIEQFNRGLEAAAEVVRADRFGSGILARKILALRQNPRKVFDADIPQEAYAPWFDIAQESAVVESGKATPKDG